MVKRSLAEIGVDQQPRRHRFSRTFRITHRRDFERTFSDGIRTADRLMRLWLRPNGLPHTRLGLVVGRSHGNAVRRNRIKRLLREAFRLTRSDLPTGYDVICAPHFGRPATLGDYQNSLQRLMRRALRKEAPPTQIREQT